MAMLKIENFDPNYADRVEEDNIINFVITNSECF